MTEAEWLSCADPQRMLDFLGTRASDRKLRLWACACVHRIEHLVPHELGHQAVAVTERFVDGLADEREVFSVADAFYPCGLYNAVYDHPATRAAHAPLYRETVGQAATYAVRCRKGPDRVTEQAAQVALLHDIFGNPFRAAMLDPFVLGWNAGTVIKLAQGIYDERAFDLLPILADALEDAGCTNQDILEHCRTGGEHVRGCWVIDLLLGKG